MKSFYNGLVKQVYVERGAEKCDAVTAAEASLPRIGFRVVANTSEIPEEHLRGTTLYLRKHPGNPVGWCPGSRGHLCCNYHTIDLYAGCGLGCSYCIMKSYLNFSPVTVYVDPARAIEEVRKLARANGKTPLRIGTGEVGDSLLYDPIFRLSESFVTGLSDLDNVHFEMKTKTDFVDHLLGIKNKGNAIIGFSLNPPEIATKEEGVSSPVHARLAAAHRAVKAGFRTSFHFDPVFKVGKWRDHYFPLIDELQTFPKESVACISLGTFRYTPGLKKRIAARPYLYDEYFPSVDGKYRYLQKVRVGIYRELFARIREAVDAPVYLCMESKAVWKRVYGALPNDIGKLDAIFDDDSGRVDG